MASTNKVVHITLPRVLYQFGPRDDQAILLEIREGWKMFTSLKIKGRAFFKNVYWNNLLENLLEKESVGLTLLIFTNHINNNLNVDFEYCNR